MSRRLTRIAATGQDSIQYIDDIENIDMNDSRNSTKSKTKLGLCTPKSKKTEIRKRSNSSNSDDTDEIQDNKVKVSPPKQGKFGKISNRNNLLSPSSLIHRLSIDDSAESSEPEEEKVEVTRNKFQNARRILNSAETMILPGREEELKELSTFLSINLNNSTSASLYVSGPPGTGKTACLSKLFNSKEFDGKFVKVYVNCTSISTIGSIYKKICTELKLKPNGKTEKDHLQAIERYLVKHHKMILMILDEIDQLVGKKQAVLYTIFEWPSKPNSKMILVGIANSLDLTDRMLTRLNANCELKPKLMHFAPYSKQQIVDIFKSRLEQAGVLDIFPAVTIQLLAGKVAAVSGDVRRALDIGRRVVEIAENHRSSGAKKHLNLGELGLADDNQEESKTVQVQQVVSVLNSVYGLSQKLNDDIEDNSFPLQQKLLICCLLLMLRKAKNKDITIGRLHDVYKRACSKRNIMALDQAEFVGLCALVETRGIIRVVGKKEPRLNKISLQWDEEEVTAALRDKQLIASVIEDSSCLGR